MRKYFSIVFVFASLFLASCKDDARGAGSSVLRQDELVRVCTDTLREIRSYVWEKDNMMAHPIINTPDSFLLGECNMVDLGTIKADVLTQFACPIGFQYPDSAELDSACLYIYYNSWFGDGNAPLRITAYEMDRATFHYDSLYTSNLDITAYCSMSDSTRALYRDRIVTASTYTDSVYSSTVSKFVPMIRIRLNDRLAKKLFAFRDFSSQKAFNDYFKGLLLTSNFGGSTCLYVRDIAIGVHYHYTYLPTADAKHYETMPDSKFFYANKEVRQVNRYDFPQRDMYVYDLMQELDSSNYIVSPCYVYTVIELPMQQFKQRILDSIGDIDHMRTYMNLASLSIEVQNGKSDGSALWNWAKPAQTMLLIREDSIDNFFKHNGLPSSEYAITAPLMQTVDTVTNDYKYTYTFDLVTLFTKYLRNSETSEKIRMVLLPVNLQYTTASSTSVVSKVSIEQAVTATQVKSAKCPDSPMDIEIVFSGFSNVILR